MPRLFSQMVGSLELGCNRRDSMRPVSPEVSLGTVLGWAGLTWHGRGCLLLTLTHRPHQTPADVPAFTAALQALSRAHLQRPRRVWRPRHGGGVERLGERRLSLWILSGRTHKHVLQTGQAGCYPGTGPSVSSFSPPLPRVKCTDARDLPGNPPIWEDASPL